MYHTITALYASFSHLKARGKVSYASYEMFILAMQEDDIPENERICKSTTMYQPDFTLLAYNMVLVAQFKHNIEVS